jgi:uncharacterized protein (DUF433 family)
MSEQIKHIRTSKFGKKFVAGSRIEVDREEPEEENIFDKEQELEIPVEDVQEIREATGAKDEEILEKVVELGTNDVSKIIEELNGE